MTRRGQRCAAITEGQETGVAEAGAVHDVRRRVAGVLLDCLGRLGEDAVRCGGLSAPDAYRGRATGRWWATVLDPGFRRDDGTITDDGTISGLWWATVLDPGFRRDDGTITDDGTISGRWWATVLDPGFRRDDGTITDDGSSRASMAGPFQCFDDGTLREVQGGGDDTAGTAAGGGGSV